MTKLELEIRNRAGEKLVVLAWSAQRTELLFATDDMRSAAARWLTDGVREWVEGDGRRIARHTPSTDAKFLARLKGDLARQFPTLTFGLSAVRVVTPAVRAPLAPTTGIMTGAPLSQRPFSAAASTVMMRDTGL